MKTTKLLFFFFGMVLSLFLVGCSAVPSKNPGPIVMGYTDPLAPRNVSEIQKIPSINWIYASGRALGIPYSLGGDMLRINIADDTVNGMKFITVLRTGNIVLSTSEEFVGDLFKLPTAVPGGTVDVVIDFYNTPANGGAWITSHTITLGLSRNYSRWFNTYSYQIEGPGKVVRTHN